MRWQPSRPWVPRAYRSVDESFLPNPFWEEYTEPRLDVIQTDTSIIVKASLPGVKPEDLDVHVSNSFLMINAEHREDKQSGKSRYLQQEMRYGHFSRTIQLPEEVDADRAEAIFENGELVLTLPKQKGQESRRIRVRAHREAKSK
ncbi:MAG: Hsp20/alpha crystallin family protein [Chloroflexi bacterium]|nr:Hsp20/alpha crystallin family protein [Chloroflexota bacterium]